MNVGTQVRDVLKGGTTNGLCPRQRVGPQGKNPIYPEAQIHSFSEADDICKDYGNENYTVTIIAWATEQREAEIIGEAIKVDMKAANPSEIKRIKYLGRGPWLQNAKKMHGRPFEFEVIKPI